jgi:hypothetical protein
LAGEPHEKSSFRRPPKNHPICIKKRSILDDFMAWLGGTPGSSFEKTFQVGLPSQNPIQRPVGILFGTMNERKKPGFWQHADAETRVFTTILT